MGGRAVVSILVLVGLVLSLGVARDPGAANAQGDDETLEATLAALETRVAAQSTEIAGLRASLATATLPATDAPPERLDCQGATSYVQSVQRIMATADIVSIDVDVPTSDELRADGEHLRDIAQAISELEPPPAATAFADAHHRAVLLMSDMFLSGAEFGLIAMWPYADALDEAVRSARNHAALFEIKCQIAMWDHSGDGEPDIGWGRATPAPSPTPAPRPTSQTLPPPPLTTTATP